MAETINFKINVDTSDMKRKLKKATASAKKLKDALEVLQFKQPKRKWYQFWK